MAEAVAQHAVDLGDHLHVGVFDAVVHGLDEMAGPVGAEAGGAGCAVDSARRSPRGSARPGPKLAAGPPTMIEGPWRAPSSPPETPMPRKSSPRAFSAAARRRVSWKSALPASITRSPGSRSGASVVDHRIDRGAGLDHDQDGARPGQRRDEGGRGGAAGDAGAERAGIGEKAVGRRGGAVVDRDGESPFRRC